MYRFLLDFYENTFVKHPIFSSLVVLYISFNICLFVYSSVTQWNLHPVEVSCSVGTNNCVVNTYSYEHSFCWDYLFESLLSSHHSNRIYSKCTIPRIKTSTKNDIKFTDIADVKVKQLCKASHVMLVMKDNSEVDIYDTVTATYAKDKANKLKGSIHGCLNPSDNSLYDFIDDCSFDIWF